MKDHKQSVEEIKEFYFTRPEELDLFVRHEREYMIENNSNNVEIEQIKLDFSSLS